VHVYRALLIVYSVLWSVYWALLSVFIGLFCVNSGQSQMYTGLLSLHIIEFLFCVYIGHFVECI